MADSSVDISHRPSKAMEHYVSERFDAVITVRDEANEACPVFPGTQRHLHWGLPDLSNVTGTEVEQLAIYRQVRDAIRTRFERELLPNFAVAPAGDGSSQRQPHGR